MLGHIAIGSPDIVFYYIFESQDILTNSICCENVHIVFFSDIKRCRLRRYCYVGTGNLRQTSTYHNLSKPSIQIQYSIYSHNLTMIPISLFNSSVLGQLSYTHAAGLLHNFPLVMKIQGLLLFSRDLIHLLIRHTRVVHAEGSRVLIPLMPVQA